MFRMKNSGKIIGLKSVRIKVSRQEKKGLAFIAPDHFKRETVFVSQIKDLTIRLSSFNSVHRIKGLGKKSVTDISDFVVNVRKPQFKKSWDAYANLIHTWDKQDLINKTYIKALLLDNENCILGEVTIHKTQLAKAELVDLVKVLKRNNAQSVVFGQNFLEARIRPSEREKKQALLVKKLADNLRIEVKDQIILSDGAYYSYAENGLY
jgi:DNA repair protein RadC